MSVFVAAPAGRAVFSKEGLSAWLRRERFCRLVSTFGVIASVPRAVRVIIIRLHLVRVHSDRSFCFCVVVCAGGWAWLVFLSTFVGWKERRTLIPSMSWPYLFIFLLFFFLERYGLDLESPSAWPVVGTRPPSRMPVGVRSRLACIIIAKAMITALVFSTGFGEVGLVGG